MVGFISAMLLFALLVSYIWKPFGCQWGGRTHSSSAGARAVSGAHAKQLWPHFTFSSRRISEHARDTICVCFNFFVFKSSQNMVSRK